EGSGGHARVWRQQGAVGRVGGCEGADGGEGAGVSGREDVNTKIYHGGTETRGKPKSGVSCAGAKAPFIRSSLRGPKGPLFHPKAGTGKQSGRGPLVHPEPATGKHSGTG